MNNDGDVHCVFIVGKSYVSPTKVTTIPRLELTEAAVSVTVSNILREELVYYLRQVRRPWKEVR